MSDGFVHSVKVPRLYKISATIARSVREDGGSLKTLVFQSKHPNVSAIYALTLHTLQKRSQLDYLIRKTRILLNEPRLDPWLARVLITELLWGKGRLQSNSKPIQMVLGYERKLQEELRNIDEVNQALPPKTVSKPRYVRVNTILISVNGAISSFKDAGWSLLPRCDDYSSHLKSLSNLSGSYYIQDFHVPELFAFPPETHFYDHYDYHNGKLILQDKASCLPPFLLNPPPGSVALDMCAAPGMKTSHLAAIMQNKGKIYAAEIHDNRYAVLCQRIKLTDAFCVKPLHRDATTLTPHECANVEYILVDPSCSGSGIMDRPKLSEEEEVYTPERLKSLHSFQFFLLFHALTAFPSVKKVVYSTCSIHPEENEEVVEEVLTKIGKSYKLVNTKKMFGDSWINYSSKNYKCKEKCLYARSEVDLCNGFFVAIFERNFDIPLYTVSGKSKYHDQTNIETQTVSNEGDEKISDGTNEVFRKKKKRKKKKGTVRTPVEDQEIAEDIVEEKDEGKIETPLEEISNNDPPKKSKKRKSKNKEQEPLPELEEIPQKKSKKKKSKHKDDELQEVEIIEIDVDQEIGQESATDVQKSNCKKKKKKKKKEKEDVDA